MRGQDILKWPEFTMGAFYGALVFFAIGLIIFLLLRFYTGRERTGEILWNRMLAYCRKRGLDAKEQRFVRGFFDQLDDRFKERTMRDRAWFRGQFRDYVRARHAVSSRGRVRVYQKLFPEIDYRLEIIDPTDLQSGELCSLGGKKRTMLAAVVESTADSIRVRFQDPGHLAAFPEGLRTYLFAYRPLLGEFILHGRIYERSGDAALFRFDGRVEAIYETHLMIERTLPIRLVAVRPRRPHDPPPPPDADLSGQPAAPTVNAGPDGAEQKEEMFVEGTTDRISDRAMSFRMAPGHDTESLRNFIRSTEIWQCDLLMDHEFQLKCKGSLIPGKQRGDFLFRYRDMNETDHRILFEYIRKAGGVRERL